MRFRLKALMLHMLASLAALTLVLGSLYLGWYRWPGWYLANAAQVILMLACVDLVLGPMLTFVIASPSKSRRTLTRDIAVIAAVQLCALVYGTVFLWNGRPLYYAFSEEVLQIVQAYDIDEAEVALARRQKAPLLPHWYSLPRWIWAPLPDDPNEQNRIVSSAVLGGDDVISMPRYYKPWSAGLPKLRGELKKVADIKYFSVLEKRSLEARMRAAGIATDRANAMAITGRGRPLLAVFDPATLALSTILRPG
jgi:hypothetical protein